MKSIGQFELFPFVHSYSNIKTTEDILRPVSVPDVLPTGIAPNVDFSMVAGEFVEVYDTEDQHGEGVCGRCIVSTW